MKKMLFSAAAMLFTLSLAYGQCTTWSDPSPTTGYTNFNTSFGGAPCTASPPTTFEITGFEIWASEAYSMANIKAGGSYTFSACNGPGAGAWNPVFTIINPTGVVEAFGKNPGSTCALTWTAAQTGTYLIVVNRSGSANCGVPFSPQQDNGFPAITYNGGASCDPPVTTCEAGTLDVSATAATLCPGAVTSINVIGMVLPNSPTIGGGGIRFLPVPGSGSGGNGVGFSLTGISPASYPYEFDNDLNGVLSFNGLAPLVGEWTLRPFVRADAAAPTVVACDTTFAAATINFLSSGAEGCGEFVCEAGDVTAVDQAICPGEEWSLTITGEILPIPGDVYWFFLDTNDVTGESDYIFNLGSDPTFYNFVGNFNALLAGAALDTIVPGTYLTFSGIFNPADTTICDVTDNAFIIDVLDGDDVACGGAPACELPYPQVTGTTETFQANGVLFSWNPIPGSLGCEIQGGLASGGPTQTFQVIQPNLSQFFVPQGQLNPGTNYRWRVRCGCSFTVGGPWTPYQNFLWNPGAGIAQDNTSDERGVTYASDLTWSDANENSTAVPFRNLLSEDGIYGQRVTPVNVKSARALRPVGSVAGTKVIASFGVFPNPSVGMVNVTYTSSTEGAIVLRAFDAAGRLVKSWNVAVNGGSNLIQVDMSVLDKGLYTLELSDGISRSVQKVVLN
jgi:hypothetical protein